MTSSNPSSPFGETGLSRSVTREWQPSEEKQRMQRLIRLADLLGHSARLAGGKPEEVVRITNPVASWAERTDQMQRLMRMTDVFGRRVRRAGDSDKAKAAMPEPTTAPAVARSETLGRRVAPKLTKPKALEVVAA